MLLTVSAQGSCLKKVLHTKVCLTREYKRNIPLRGDVTEFSRASRMRMIELVASLSHRKMTRAGKKPLFITLTYVDNVCDYKKAKRDLKVMLQRIARMKPECSGIWKMEIQKRGAIHFHIILFNAGFIDVGTLQSMWCEVTGENANNSLDLEIIRSKRGVIYYVTKYMCKGENTRGEDRSEEEKSLGDDGGVGLSIPHTRPTGTGRWWGVHNRKGLPMARRVVVEIDLCQGDYLGWVCGLREKYARCYRNFTVFSRHCYAYVWRLERIRERRAALYDAWALQKQARRGFRAMLWRQDSRVSDDAIMVLMYQKVKMRKAYVGQNFITWGTDDDSGAVIEKVLKPSLHCENEKPTQIPLL